MKVSDAKPYIWVFTTFYHNSFNFVSGTTEMEPVMLSIQDKDILNISEKLENNSNANFKVAKLM